MEEYYVDIDLRYSEFVNAKDSTAAQREVLKTLANGLRSGELLSALRVESISANRTEEDEAAQTLGLAAVSIEDIDPDTGEIPSEVIMAKKRKTHHDKQFDSYPPDPKKAPSKQTKSYSPKKPKKGDN